MYKFVRTLPVDHSERRDYIDPLLLMNVLSESQYNENQAALELYGVFIPNWVEPVGDF